MTGKEILEEEFEKAGMRGGYNAQQVDAFLQRVASYVDDVNQQNSDLNYKIKILADKIEEYKADEENIRAALLGAQKLGTSVVNEAKAKAEAMTREARAASEEMLSQARAKIDALTRESKQKTSMELSAMKRECDLEQRTLEKMKQEVSNFKNFLLKQYKAQLQLLTNLPSMDDRGERPAPAAPVPAPPPEPRPAPEPPPEYPRQEEPEPVRPAAVSAAPEPEPEEQALPAPEIIHSDPAPIEEELEQDVQGQTKEFAANQGGEGGRQEPRRPQRQNYIEKFGELKFGSFTDKE